MRAGSDYLLITNETKDIMDIGQCSDGCLIHNFN